MSEENTHLDRKFLGHERPLENLRKLRVTCCSPSLGGKGPTINDITSQRQLVSMEEILFLAYVKS